MEQVRFLRVDRPPTPGAILHASTSWEEPAGGGGVAAVELARLAGACDLFTARGDDPVGAGLPSALGAYGVRVRGPVRPEPHRLAVTFLDPTGERTIAVVGPAQHARGAELDPGELDGMDAVYFCKGDADALRLARRARVLVATARQLDVVRASGVRLDALVHSDRDPGERYADGDLAVPPTLVASTRGEEGGVWRTSSARGRWAATPLPGPVQDAYGCGDCFAAGLAFALAEGRPIPDALRCAAERGALALTRRGAHGGAPASAV